MAKELSDCDNEISRVQAQINQFAILLTKKMKRDLKWYLYQIVTRQELRNPDYVKRFQFCRYFFNEYRKRRFLANMIVDDEAEFSLNDEVNSRIARQYVPVGEPPNFYYQKPDLCQKLTV